MLCNCIFILRMHSYTHIHHMRHIIFFTVNINQVVCIMSHFCDYKEIQMC